MLGWGEGIEVGAGMASPDGPLRPRERGAPNPTSCPIALLVLLVLLLVLG